MAALQPWRVPVTGLTAACPPGEDAGACLPSQVFLLARHPDSFDSRYYGPIDARLARGIARPLVTLAD